MFVMEGRVSQRKALQLAIRILVLHECGYKCSNPICRMVLTLDIHHIEYVSEGAGDGQENLLALCRVPGAPGSRAYFAN